MKVGDYVRTDKGVIGKYNIVKTGKTIPNWNGGYGYKEIEKEYIDNNIYNRFDDKIIKSSPNIIDLIEVGDYVNGHRVVEVDLDDIDDYGNTFRYIKAEHDYSLNYWVKESEIETILTKEMFESMEYRIGE